MKVGPKYKIGKRLGASVFEKCQTPKFALSQARTEQAKMGKRRRGAKSEYARQFLEKQKVRVTYGISEKQFKNYVEKANESKNSNPSESLYRLLESRLDNTVYRLGLASTRRAARQYVSHGHITVNGRKVTVPSFKVSQGDVVAVRKESMTSVTFANLKDTVKDNKTPVWLAFDIAKNGGAVTGEPIFDRTANAYDLTPVLEFYSR